MAADIKRYKQVTKADVNRVYQTYLKGKHAVLMSVVPKGQAAMMAKADNFPGQNQILAVYPPQKPKI